MRSASRRTYRPRAMYSSRYAQRLGPGDRRIPGVTGEPMPPDEPPAPVEPGGYLLLESGGRLLTEAGGGVLLEG